MKALVERDLTLHVTRLIVAPRERVFAAWITPADLEKWFGPEECKVLSARIHPRVEGEYQLRLKTENCGEVSLHGVFRELKRPGKLIYTWNMSGHPKLEFGESLVTVEFLDRNGATEVQITHEQLPNEEVKEDHNHGWNGCLDKLEKHLAGTISGQQCASPVGEFSWNELLTSDEAGAAKFYTQVFGWQTADFPGGGMKYTLFKKGGKEVAGLMRRPMEEMPAHWLGYISVADVDATAKKVGEAGGQVMMPPFDVPTVGRIAVIHDPQGVAVGIFQPLAKAVNHVQNQVVWCDIPVKVLDRAIRFYSAVLGASIKKEQFGDMTFATLPHEHGGVSGCLSPAGEDSEPSSRGALLYFNCEGRLDEAVAAVAPNGGKVVQPKHQIGPYGFRAVVLDSEGNRIALHSM
ncbi:MAG: SRPBCC domain-containing protein [Verrucomicrobia bacterium]|nr:SRPBCC domain-containing protein [Verrucomicrobiota bacterium]